VISLQAVLSAFWDDPRIYNPASYLICAPFLLAWVIVALRFRPTAARVWLGLAAIAAFSVLPIYHRQYDAKLLLLAVPACAILWAEGGLTGRLALLVTAAGFLVTGDLSSAILMGLINHLHLNTAGLAGRILMAVQVFPAPLTLLVMGIFYLWVYLRRSSAKAPPEPLESGAGT
jgi:hypothetical protein